jgi:hypothetical protein
MKVFTVHEPAGLKGRSAAAARRVVFIKEGFSWPAFLVPPLWLAYQRMWWVLLGFLAIGVAVAGIERWLQPDPFPVTVVEFALLLLFALEANNLRRWNLRRRSYRLRAVVTGRDREECEHRFFTTWLAEMPAEPERAVSRTVPPAVAHGSPSIIGMFPEPGGR